MSAALRAPSITQGPAIEAFEQSLIRATGAKYAVAFSSGTAALHAAYAALGLKKGDEIITTGLTFAATASMMLALELKPVFADIDAQSGTLDPEAVEKKITKRTRAIVAVDYAGRPVDIDALRKVARKHKLVFIEDGAQSLGASYHKKRVGSQADMTMFSFHPVKSITTGEGGAIATDTEVYAKRMRRFRTHGITKDRSEMKRRDKAAWYHEMLDFGFNYRLTDIQAALGVSQMKRLRSHVQKRKALADRYFKLLKNIKGLELPAQDDAIIKSAWHLFPIRVAPEMRDRIFTKLRAKGIGVQVHYVPVYMHPYYANLGYKRGTCPKTEVYSASEISIPLYPTLSKKEQDYVVSALKNILASL